MIKYYILLVTLFAPSLWAAQMPGLYPKSSEELQVMHQFTPKKRLKVGGYEHYYIDSKRMGASDLTFATFAAPEEMEKIWIELRINSKVFGVSNLKMLLDKKKLFDSKVERLQLLLKDHKPFELVLDEAQQVDTMKKMFAGDKKVKVVKKEKYLKKMKINQKEIELEAFRITMEDKRIIEIALLPKKDRNFFGIAYLKSDKFQIYLKAYGTNAVSIFPKKVPKVDFIKNLKKFNKTLNYQAKKDKEAMKKEMEQERGKKNLDPIDQLNQMIDQE